MTRAYRWLQGLFEPWTVKLHKRGYQARPVLGYPNFELEGYSYMSGEDMKVEVWKSLWDWNVRFTSKSHNFTHSDISLGKVLRVLSMMERHYLVKPKQIGGGIDMSKEIRNKRPGLNWTTAGNNDVTFIDEFQLSCYKRKAAKTSGSGGEGLEVWARVNGDLTRDEALAKAEAMILQEVRKRKARLEDLEMQIEYAMTERAKAEAYK